MTFLTLGASILCDGTTMASTDYCLHQQIFKGDLAEVSKLIRVSDINAKDVHGRVFDINVLLIINEHLFFNILAFHSVGVKLVLF